MNDEALASALSEREEFVEGLDPEKYDIDAAFEAAAWAAREFDFTGRTFLRVFEAEVIGDGQKYIKHEGELYPFTGCSRNDRLHHGETVAVRFYSPDHVTRADF